MVWWERGSYTLKTGFSGLPAVFRVPDGDTMHRWVWLVKIDGQVDYRRKNKAEEQSASWGSKEEERCDEGEPKEGSSPPWQVPMEGVGRGSPKKVVRQNRREMFVHSSTDSNRWNGRFISFLIVWPGTSYKMMFVSLGLWNRRESHSLAAGTEETSMALLTVMAACSQSGCLTFPAQTPHGLNTECQRSQHPSSLLRGGAR